MKRMSAIGGLLALMLYLTTCAAPSPPAETPRPISPTPTTPIGPIRPPAVAGSWYPADPTELAQMMDGMLEAERPVDGTPVALIVPHAGYVFSGPVAAAGFRQLTNGQYFACFIAQC